VPIQGIVFKLLILLEVNPSSLKPTQRQASNIGFDSINQIHFALSHSSWEAKDELFSPHISGKCLGTYVLAFLLKKIRRMMHKEVLWAKLLGPGVH